MKRINRPLAVFVLALAASGLAGCSQFSPQTTALQYAPGDGTQLDLEGGVGVRNAIFLASDADAPGTLIATFVNEGADDATVSVTGDGIDGRVRVPAGQAVQVGPEAEEQLEVDRMGARPGELVRVQITTETAGAELAIPVMDGTQAEFSDLVPSATATES